MLLITIALQMQKGRESKVNMQAKHLAFISPESEATISTYLPLSPKLRGGKCKRREDIT